ncbi:hypothetical protein [Nocardia acididurans]|uniref:hypothetical protein n=1 Tax=Nocardia acididurans TaxID=2802282 RepID=UPI001E603E18|nr:hypothetical protein [Nocardia acididurans]
MHEPDRATPTLKRHDPRRTVLSEMASLADRYRNNIERSKRIDRSTPESEITDIGKEIELLDYELRHTSLEPSARRELIELSGVATATLARQVHAARSPLVIDPAPQPTHPTPRPRGNAITEAAHRNRDRGRER